MICMRALMCIFVSFRSRFRSVPIIIPAFKICQKMVVFLTIRVYEGVPKGNF